MSDPRRALPSVNALLESDTVRPLLASAPRELVVNATPGSGAPRFAMRSLHDNGDRFAP